MIDASIYVAIITVSGTFYAAYIGNQKRKKVEKGSVASRTVDQALEGLKELSDEYKEDNVNLRTRLTASEASQSKLITKLSDLEKRHTAYEKQCEEDKAMMKKMIGKMEKRLKKIEVDNGSL